MLYVTCGHTKGIGLEIFLKSFLLLTKIQKNQIVLFVRKNSLYRYLKDLSFSNEIIKDLHIEWLEEDSNLESTASLEAALSKITPKDILITLPTSKDQLIYKNNFCAGYTEYFREFFQNMNLSMVFNSYTENVLLITDHIPLALVSKKINSDLINKKLEITINGFNKYFRPIDEILIAGINPHSGENGILGKEELCLKINAIKNCTIKNFIPGDTLHVHKKISQSQLFVYMYHDQGLASFKARNLFTGINITLGLPFLRLSVDHGTAFNLYGKNEANINGMMYLFNKAFEVHCNVNK